MLDLRYTLTEKDIEDSLFCLNYKREGWFKKVNIIMLSLVTLIALIQYMRHPQHVYYMGIALLALLLLFYFIYIARLLRRQKARKIVRQGSDYRLQISGDGLLAGDKGEKRSFKEVKGSLLISERTLTLKVGRDVYCIPKSSVSEQEFQKLQTIMNENGCDMVRIITER